MISTGITYLDKITGGLRLGDNVVWQISDGIPVDSFINHFFGRQNNFNRNVIYVNFNFSPHTICKKYSDLFKNQHVILVDGFTNGKGNSDRVFLDFYNDPLYKNADFILLEDPKNFRSFVETLTRIENDNRDGSFYIFDSLTGMNELWKQESQVLDFFTYTCPKLYDLNTLAYWVYERNAHSKEFIAGISHITQVVFALNYTAGDHFDFNIQKLEGRYSLFNSSVHRFKFANNDIQFQEMQPDDFLNIGDKVKTLRKKNNKTQAELAVMLGLTPGAISQIENSVVSPSLNTLLQLSTIFNKTPEYFLGDIPAKKTDPDFVISKRKELQNHPDKKISIYELLENSDSQIKMYSVRIREGYSADGPVLYHKGAEVIYITEGTAHVTIEGSEYTLRKGESVYLAKSFIEKLKNEDKLPCEFIYILL